MFLLNSLLLSFSLTISLSVLWAIFRKLVSFSFPVSIKCNVTFHRFFPRKLENSDCKPLPSLVICPPTLTGHWVYEVEKFVSKDFLKTASLFRPTSREAKVNAWVLKSIWHEHSFLSVKRLVLKTLYWKFERTLIKQREFTTVWICQFSAQNLVLFRCLKRHTTLGRRYMKSLAFFPFEGETRE